MGEVEFRRRGRINFTWLTLRYIADSSTYIVIGATSFRLRGSACMGFLYLPLLGVHCHLNWIRRRCSPIRRVSISCCAWQNGVSAKLYRFFAISGRSHPPRFNGKQNDFGCVYLAVSAMALFSSSVFPWIFLVFYPWFGPILVIRSAGMSSVSFNFLWVGTTPPRICDMSESGDFAPTVDSDLAVPTSAPPASDVELFDLIGIAILPGRNPVVAADIAPTVQVADSPIALSIAPSGAVDYSEPLCAGDQPHGESHQSDIPIPDYVSASESDEDQDLPTETLAVQSFAVCAPVPSNATFPFRRPRRAFPIVNSWSLSRQLHPTALYWGRRRLRRLNPLCRLMRKHPPFQRSSASDLIAKSNRTSPLWKPSLGMRMYIPAPALRIRLLW